MVEEGVFGVRDLLIFYNISSIRSIYIVVTCTDFTRLLLFYFSNNVSLQPPPPVQGPAEAIRLALTIGKIPFTDEVIPFETWKTSKP